jgi:hypothetical protein
MNKLTLIVILFAVSLIFAGCVQQPSNYPLPAPVPSPTPLIVSGSYTSSGVEGFGSVGSSTYARADNTLLPQTYTSVAIALPGAYGTIQTVIFTNTGKQNATINFTDAFGNAILPGGVFTLLPGQVYSNTSVGYINSGNLNINVSSTFLSSGTFPSTNWMAGFPFNEGSGSVSADLSGFANNLTLNGNYNWLFSKINPRLNADSIQLLNGYMNVTPSTLNFTNQTGSTLCFWLNSSQNVPNTITSFWVQGGYLTSTGTFSVTNESHAVFSVSPTVNATFQLSNFSGGVYNYSVAIQNATGAVLSNTTQFNVTSTGFVTFYNVSPLYNQSLWFNTTSNLTQVNGTYGYGFNFFVNYTYYNWTGLTASNYSISVYGNNSVNLTAFNNTQLLSWTVQSNNTAKTLVAQMINTTGIDFMNDSILHDYCFRQNATTMEMYRDSVLVNTTSYANSFYNGTASNVYFGTGWINATSSYNSTNSTILQAYPELYLQPYQYDSLHFFNTYLTTTQITYLYANESQPVTVLSSIIIKRS